jgi:peptidoglycan-associated lipoprotein
MRLSSLLILLGFLALSSPQVLAQNKKYIKAYEAYNANEYNKAIDLFKEAYERITDKEEKTKIIFHVAECYRKTNKPKQAALWYSKALAKDYEDPVAVLYMADMLKMKGDYEEAKVQYNAYKELVPSDSRGADGVKACNLAMEWIEFPSGYNVTEQRFINSKANDFSPVFAREDYRVLYFTSSRDETIGKKEHGGTGQSFSDIFMTTMDRKGKWSTPVPLSEEVNTEFEEGAASLSADFSKLYFTRCQVSTNKTLGCAVYEAVRRNDEWTKAKSLEIAADSVLIAHPAISADELTLYFVSDMEGSQPGADGKTSSDIWKVTRGAIDEDWGSPINLGSEINTSGTEAFPYAHKDGSLYFSSNGHIGMGGLDIFKATIGDDGKWDTENLRYPVNSSSDDFGICFETSREAGYFSSTRKGKTDDIYTFLLPPLKFNITGVVKDEKTDEPLGGAQVKSIGSDGLTLEATTDNEGAFKFMLKPGTDYVFLAKNDGYLQGKERETTKNLENSADFSTVIYLAPIDKPITVENIFFDFASADLRPESMVALDQLVETLNDNPNITIELSSHTDSRGNDDFNLDLSQQRAQSVVNYLISKGIATDRLVAKGYGENEPKVVDRRDHEAYPFLREGQELVEGFIETIEDEDLQEVAHFLNRRTEFKVLRTDYKE